MDVLRVSEIKLQLHSLASLPYINISSVNQSIDQFMYLRHWAIIYCHFILTT